MATKVLIIEDDEFLSDMYKTKFSQEGFEVYTAMDGVEALEKLTSKEIEPDIILLDVVMPKMDGIEVLEKIKSEESIKDIPVVMLTNLGQQEEVEKALSEGAKDYLVKANYTPSEVVRKIKSIIGK